MSYKTMKFELWRNYGRDISFIVNVIDTGCTNRVKKMTGLYNLVKFAGIQITIPYTFDSMFKYTAEDGVIRDFTTLENWEDTLKEIQDNVLSYERPVLEKEDTQHSKYWKYQGCKFITVQHNVIMWCDNWDIVTILVNNGYAEKVFYKDLYGHTEYILKES